MKKTEKKMLIMLINLTDANLLNFSRLNCRQMYNVVQYPLCTKDPALCKRVYGIIIIITQSDCNDKCSSNSDVRQGGGSSGNYCWNSSKEDQTKKKNNDNNEKIKRKNK